VLHEILRRLRVEQIRACDAALREGIVEVLLDDSRDGRQQPGSVRRMAVMELFERTDIEEAHATHVARLALRIFDQLQDVHRLNTGERELLEYAALLHEAGMHVAYSNHQKHSYYLISHAGLRGFTSDQVAIVANVARYYRKAKPADGDENFAQLSETQRDVVRKLAAILRVADALDRGRRRAVRDVGVDASNGAVRFRLRLRGDADVELQAAWKRAKYFRKVFGTDVDFEESSAA
jgi:exopolyphosphatase/guanosine-5'-triphosphate,3'-diphosphate pyrophosphatase